LFRRFDAWRIVNPFRHFDIIPQYCLQWTPIAIGAPASDSFELRASEAGLGRIVGASETVALGGETADRAAEKATDMLPLTPLCVSGA
jgi:hypothetical protein